MVAATGRRYYHADSCVKRRRNNRPVVCIYAITGTAGQDQISLYGGVAA